MIICILLSITSLYNRSVITTRSSFIIVTILRIDYGSVFNLKIYSFVPVTAIPKTKIYPKNGNSSYICVFIFNNFTIAETKSMHITNDKYNLFIRSFSL